MADMKVTVLITGIVFCRQSKEQFESLFLHVDKHELKLDVTRTEGLRSSNQMYPIPTNSRLSITTTNAESTHPDELDEHKRYDWVVDVDALQNRAGGQKITLLEPPTVPLSYLTVANAVCYTARLSNREYEFWKNQGGRRTPIDGSTTFVGQEIGIDFFIKEGGNLALEISNTTDTAADVAANSTYNFPYEDGVEYEIKFDNACIDMSCGEDFYFYYEILDGHGIEIEEVLAGGMTGERVMSDEMACNPGKGDPTCNFELYFREGICGLNQRD